MGKAVFNQPSVGQLIAVRALDFRRDWNSFLELISPDYTRKKFLDVYKQLKKEGRIITNEEELNELLKERSETDPSYKDIAPIYRELLKQGPTLRRFLDVGAADILLEIKEMEGLRRALNTAKLKPTIYETTDELLYLLRDGKVEEFNGIVSKPEFSLYLDFAGAYLPGANLSRANLSNADLSNADLRGRIDYRSLICTDATFNNAIINDDKLSNYLHDNKAKNVPSFEE